MIPNTTPQPDLMSAEDFAEFISDEAESFDNFNYSWIAGNMVPFIKQRDAQIRAQAIDETLERAEKAAIKWVQDYIYNNYYSEFGIHRAIRALKTTGESK